jgi:hypothetical protein
MTILRNTTTSDIQKGPKKTKRMKTNEIIKTNEDEEIGDVDLVYNIHCGNCLVITLEQISFIGGFILGCILIRIGICPI